MDTHIKRALVLVAAALLSAAPVTEAYEKGDWIVAAGAGAVDPKSTNGTIVSVDSTTSLILSGEYMLSDQLGIEVLGAWPFTHDIRLAADGSKVGETKHLPPTFSLKYHFATDGAVNPYIGAGVNYTTFFEESTTGALAGARLSLDDSFGIAAQAGLDWMFSDSMLLSINLRWVNIEADASVDGVFLETVKIDPLVYGISIGWTF